MLRASGTMAEPQPVEPTAGDVPKDDAAGSQPAEGHVTTQPVTPHGKSVPGSPANTTRPVAAPGLGGDSLAAPPPPSTQPPAAAQPGRSLQASIFGASTTSASHMMLASVSQQSSIWVEKQNRGRRLRQRPEGPIKPHAPRKPRSRFHPERLGPVSCRWTCAEALTTCVGGGRGAHCSSLCLRLAGLVPAKRQHHVHGQATRVNPSYGTSVWVWKWEPWEQEGVLLGRACSLPAKFGNPRGDDVQRRFRSGQAGCFASLGAVSGA